MTTDATWWQKFKWPFVRLTMCDMNTSSYVYMYELVNVNNTKDTYYLIY